MSKLISTIILTLFICSGLVLGQDGPLRTKSLILDEPIIQKEETPLPENRMADGNYIEVDLMANAFGTGSSSINPLAFDPYSNVVSILHRGHTNYAAGSGEIWYNVSADYGVNWTRVAAINGAATQKSGRYPSMAINNYTHGDISATTGIFTWAELTAGGGSFGWVGYGADQPLGGGATYSDIIQGTSNYSSDDPCWAGDNSPWVFWVSRNVNAPRDLTLFRTEDFINVEAIIPTYWVEAEFGNGQYIHGGVSRNGVQYFAAQAAFPNVAPADMSGWPMGYSKSTDDGVTWSNWVVPDWRTIPALADYDQTFDFDSTDGNTVQYDGDIQVDKWGYVHLVTALTDTNTWSHAVVDIYETSSGWSGDVIFSGLDIKTYGAGPGLGQMGPSTFVAMDSSGTVMAVQFINKSPNTKWADVYLSHKRLDVTDTWSAPINLTMSDSINNTAAHLAPQLRDNGDGTYYTAFSSYSYVTGATGPYADSTLTTSLYVAPIVFDESIVGVEDEIVANSFNLGQNYPNPFNPSTKITYTLAERSDVSLIVYDVLGNEVASLVNNKTQEAGKYDVIFDAGKLASGLYIYTLNTAKFTSSKKMMLLK